MKQSITGYFLYKNIDTAIKIDGEKIIAPIRIYLNMIDAIQEKDRLNVLRTADDLNDHIEYEVVNINVVPG